MLNDKITEICERLDWSIYLDANFDIDEHIELWIEAKRNGVKGVPSARELVYDAEAICKMLQELAAALAKEEPA